MALPPHIAVSLTNPAKYVAELPQLQQLLALIRDPSIIRTTLDALPTEGQTFGESGCLLDLYYRLLDQYEPLYVSTYFSQGQIPPAAVQEHQYISRKVRAMAHDFMTKVVPQQAAVHIVDTLEIAEISLDVRVCVAIGGLRTPAQWRDFVDEVDSRGSTLFYLAERTDGDEFIPLSRQLVSFFYGTRHAHHLRGVVEIALKETSQYDAPIMASLPSFYSEMTDELRLLNETWSAKPQVDTHDLTEGSILSLNTHIGDQHMRNSPASALLLSKGTDGMRPDDPDFDTWATPAQTPAIASDVFSRDALQLVEQTVLTPGATAGIVPLYVAICTGRLQQVNTKEHLDSTFARTLSTLWIDDAMGRYNQKDIRQVDPVVGEETLGQSPMWLLLLTEALYATVLACKVADQVTNEHQRVAGEFRNLLSEVYGLLYPGLATIPSTVRIFDPDQLETFCLERCGHVNGGTTAIDQTLDFAMQFLPAAEQEGYISQIHQMMYPALDSPSNTKQAEKNYRKMCKKVYDLPARQQFLLSANDADYEAKSLQTARRTINSANRGGGGLSLLRSYCERTAPFFEDNAERANGMMNEQQVFDLFGNPRSTQSALIKSSHLKLLRNTDKASKTVAQAYAAEGWMADVMSPSRAYLPDKIRQRKWTSPSASECIKTPRAALALIYRADVEHCPFSWMRWYYDRSQAAKTPTDFITIAGTGGKFLEDLMASTNELVRLFHPDDIAAWKRVYRQLMPMPMLGGISPFLEYAMAKATLVVDATTFGGLCKLVEPALTFLIECHNAIIPLTAGSAEPEHIVDTYSIYSVAAGESPSSNFAKTLETLTGSGDDTQNSELLRGMYVRSQASNPSVGRPAATMYAAMTALLRAQLDEAADALFGVIARAMAGWFGNVDTAALETAVDVLFKELANNHIELVDTLRLRLEWIFQLGHHLCALPGTVALCFQKYWQEFFLGVVVGPSHPQLRLRLVHGLLRSQQLPLPYTVMGHPLTSRIHESAPGAVNSSSTQNKAYVVRQTYWREALVLFCDRCARHSRQFLRSPPITELTIMQQLFYHSMVSEEGGVGAANMSDAGLVRFAIYCLIGNTSAVTSSPLDASRGRALVQAYKLVEFSHANDNGMRKFLMQTAEKHHWLEIKGSTAHFSQMVTKSGDARAQFEQLVKNEAEVIRHFKAARQACKRFASDHGLTVRPESKAEKQEARALHQEMSRLAQSYPDLQQLAGLMKAAVAKHQLAKAAQASLKVKSYRRSYPHLFDQAFERDAAHLLAQVIMQAGHDMQPLQDAVNKAMIDWYDRETEVLLADFESLMIQLAFKEVIPILQDREDLKAEAQAIENSVVVGSETYVHQQELQAMQRVISNYTAGADYDDAKWQRGVGHSVEYDRVFGLADYIDMQPTYPDYMKQVTDILALYQDDPNNIAVAGRHSLVDQYAQAIQAILNKPTELLNALADNGGIVAKNNAIQVAENTLDLLQKMHDLLVDYPQKKRDLEQAIVAASSATLSKHYNDAKKEMVGSFLDAVAKASFEQDYEDQLNSMHQKAVKQLAQDIDKVADRLAKEVTDKAEKALNGEFPKTEKLLKNVQNASKAFSASLYQPADVQYQFLQQRINEARAGVAGFIQADAHLHVHTAIQALLQNKLGTLSRDYDSYVKQLGSYATMPAVGPVSWQNDLIEAQKMAVDAVGPVGQAKDHWERALTAQATFVSNWETAFQLGVDRVSVLKDQADEAEALLQLADRNVALLADLQKKEAEAQALHTRLNALPAAPVIPAAIVAMQTAVMSQDVSSLLSEADVLAYQASVTGDLSAEMGQLQAEITALQQLEEDSQKAIDLLVSENKQLHDNVVKQQVLASHDNTHEAIKQLAVAQATTAWQGITTLLDDSAVALAQQRQNLVQLQAVNQFLATQWPKAQKDAQDRLNHLQANRAAIDAAEKADFELRAKHMRVAVAYYQHHHAEIDQIYKDNADNTLFQARRQAVADVLDTMAADPTDEDAGKAVDEAIRLLRKEKAEKEEIIRDFVSLASSTPAQVQKSYDDLQKKNYTPGSSFEKERLDLIDYGTKATFQSAILDSQASPAHTLKTFGLEADGSTAEFIEAATHLRAALAAVGVAAGATSSSIGSGSGKGKGKSAATAGTVAEKVYNSALNHIEGQLAKLKAVVAAITDPSAQAKDVANGLINPDAKLTWDQITKGHTPMDLNKEIDQQLKAAGIATSLNDLDPALVSSLKQATTANTGFEAWCRPGAEKLAAKAIQQKIDQIEENFAPSDYSVENMQFNTDWMQIKSQYDAAQAALKQSRSDLSHTVIQERTKASQSDTKAILLIDIHAVPPDDQVNKGPDPYAPIPAHALAKMDKIQDIHDRFKTPFRVWSKDANWEFLHTTHSPLLDSNRDHVGISNLISRVAFFAMELMYYRVMEWSKRVGPKGFSHMLLQRCAAYTSAANPYGSWINLVKDLAEKVDYVDFLINNPGATPQLAVNSLLNLQFVTLFRDVETFLREAETVNFAAELKHLASRGKGVVIDPPFDKVFVSDWFDPIYDQAIDASVGVVAVPAPSSGGSGSGSGSGSRITPPPPPMPAPRRIPGIGGLTPTKVPTPLMVPGGLAINNFYQPADPLPHSQTVEDGIFNFFADETMSRRPIFFNDAYLNFWRQHKSLVTLPVIKQTSQKLPDIHVPDAVAKLYYEVPGADRALEIARMAFLYTCYMRFFSAVTNIFAHTKDEWLKDVVFKGGRNRAPQLKQLYEECERARDADLQLLFDNYYTPGGPTLPPFQVNNPLLNKDKSVDLTVAEARSFFVGRLSQGYAYAWNRAKYNNFIEGFFYKPKTPGAFASPSKSAATSRTMAKLGKGKGATMAGCLDINTDKIGITVARKHPTDTTTAATAPIPVPAPPSEEIGVPIDPRFAKAVLL